MGLGTLGERRRRSGCAIAAALVVLALLVVGAVIWQRGEYVRAPEALYRAARSARPARAAVFYERLGERLPQVQEYARLWAAEAAMPDLVALRTIEDAIALRPQSPAAYEAHVFLARYYAEQEAGKARDEYLAALALNDSTALRLELARYLEAQGDPGAAYDQYAHLLNKLPDAFEGMRRNGRDPLVVAKDLIAATYDSDALDTLRASQDPKAWPLRAQALFDLGKYAEAEPAYRKWLDSSPNDPAAQAGLAATLVHLDRADDALALYSKVDTPDSKLAQAGLLASRKPDEALSLYESSQYPVGPWTATSLLEAQHRLTETLPLYMRVGGSDAAFADDAAYRLYVLGGRLGDAAAQAEGKAQLERKGLNWLASRAAKGQISLEVGPTLAPGGRDILEKSRALASIGRDDLARMELSIAGKFSHAPETQAAVAKALADRGDVADAQAIAASYIADHPAAALDFWQLSYPRPYSDTVTAAAKEFGIDPLLIWAVMRQESRFQPEALSYAGARGLMQVMPDTQTFVAGKLGEDIPPGAAYTPEASIRMGAWYLRYLLDQFGNDTELAIAAYNGGPGSVADWQRDPMVTNRDDFLRWIGFGQTREYLEQVGLNYKVYQALYGGKGL